MHQQDLFINPRLPRHERQHFEMTAVDMVTHEGQDYFLFRFHLHRRQYENVIWRLNARNILNMLSISPGYIPGPGSVLDEIKARLEAGAGKQIPAETETIVALGSIKPDGRAECLRRGMDGWVRDNIPVSSYYLRISNLFVARLKKPGLSRNF